MKDKNSDAKFYSTPEASEAEMYAQLARLSPEERLRNFCDLLRRIHGESIDTPRRLGGLAEIIDFPTD